MVFNDGLSSMKLTWRGLFGDEPASVDMKIRHRLIFGGVQQWSAHGALRLGSPVCGRGDEQDKMQG